MKKIKSILKMETYVDLKKAVTLLFVVILCNTFWTQDRVVARKWEGRLQVQGTELRIYFQLQEASPQSLKPKVNSPSQGAKEITHVLNDKPHYNHNLTIESCLD